MLYAIAISTDRRTVSLGRTDILRCGAVGVFEPIESAIAINAAERTASDCAEEKSRTIFRRLEEWVSQNVKYAILIDETLTSSDRPGRQVIQVRARHHSLRRNRCTSGFAFACGLYGTGLSLVISILNLNFPLVLLAPYNQLDK
jgi:hypothetical protein